LEHIPCASVLIRINRAPLSNDNLRTFSYSDFKTKEERIKHGVWVPRPEYNTGAYNTQFCDIKDSEKELFTHRLIRVESNVKDAALLIIKGKGESLELVSYLFAESNHIARTTTKSLIG